MGWGGLREVRERGFVEGEFCNAVAGVGGDGACTHSHERQASTELAGQRSPTLAWHMRVADGGQLSGERGGETANTACRDQAADRRRGTRQIRQRTIP